MNGIFSSLDASASFIYFAHFRDDLKALERLVALKNDFPSGLGAKIFIR